MSGYCKAQIKNWDQVDWCALQQELEETAKFAGELGIWTVIGSNHRLSEPHRPHNSLYVISASGTLHTRYDKQWCSHTELSDWYTPGQSLCSFEVEGWRFGCALCIEIQFPELFLAYESLDIDCLLFSSYSDSSLFGIQARAYAASHTFWFSFSTPSQMSSKLASHMIGPDGTIQSCCTPNHSTLCISTLDSQSEEWHIPLKLAKPWRKAAKQGEIYTSRYVSDPRSRNKQVF